MKIVVFVVLMAFTVVHSKEEKRISRIKCEVYNELAKTSMCVSEAYEYPFMGAVGYEGEEGKIEWACSGSLISNQYVLTMAHCCISPIYGPIKYVRFGEPDINQPNKNAVTYTISEVTKHPDYRPPSAYNDIALLKLDRPVQFTEYIRPACLYNGQDLPNYIIAGHNFLEKIESRTGWMIVHENVTILSEEKCNNIVQPSRKMKDGVNFETQFCTNEGPVAQEITAGGAFLHRDDELSCMQNIAGLVSLDGGFDTAVNVKVSAYVDWIESIVWPDYTDIVWPDYTDIVWP